MAYLLGFSLSRTMSLTLILSRRLFIVKVTHCVFSIRAMSAVKCVVRICQTNAMPIGVHRVQTHWRVFPMNLTPHITMGSIRDFSIWLVIHPSHVEALR